MRQCRLSEVAAHYQSDCGQHSMSILEGDLAAEFYSAFSGIYSDATLTRVTMTDDGTGSLTPSETTQPIKAQRDDITEAQRVAAGYSDRDVRILVLRQGVGEMDNNCRITLYGVVYLVSNCRSDPASAYWEVKAVKR